MHFQWGGGSGGVGGIKNAEMWNYADAIGENVVKNPKNLTHIFKWSASTS